MLTNDIISVFNLLWVCWQPVNLD